MILSIHHTNDNVIRQPSVSILINNYNYGRFLESCILSALAQDYINFEVIVVDDGSTDCSRDVMQKYSDRVTTVFKENSGQASAFNRGFELSKGEVICLLDADDIFYPNKLSEVVSLFMSNPKVEWIFHELGYIDKENKELDVKREKTIEHSVFIDAKDSMKVGNPPKEFIPCGLCFRRKVIEKILPMPESRGVSISDNYIKYAAIGLAPGLLLNEKLAAQRIHSRNTYTFRRDNHKLRAEIHVKTGFYLRQKFPDAGLFADKLFVKGVAEMLVNLDISDLRQTKEVREYIAENTNLNFLLLNTCKCLYHVCRFSFLRIKDFLSSRAIRLSN